MTVDTCLRATVAAALVAALVGCSSAPAAESQPAPMAMSTSMNGLTAAERADGWRSLFDGTTMDAWRGYKEATVPAGWRVANGIITKTTPVEDIVSKEEFGDFDLRIEWKIGEGGNSGIFYRGSEEFDKIYWTAPEYQLLDDIKAADNKTRLTCAGAAYGLYASPAGHLMPVGEWNSTRIVATCRTYPPIAMRARSDRVCSATVG